MPSNLLPDGLDCAVTITEFPVIYANAVPTVNDKGVIGSRLTEVVVCVKNLSPDIPVGPVEPVLPVMPVGPVGPSIPSKFTL